MSPESWRLAGRVKKARRGDKPLEDFVPAMARCRDELLALGAEVAANHGTTLHQCGVGNVRKLRGRFERGSVRGDGDTQ